MKRVAPLLFFLWPLVASKIPESALLYKWYRAYVLTENADNPYKVSISRNISILSEKRLVYNHAVYKRRVYLVHNDSNSDFQRYMNIIGLRPAMIENDFSTVIAREWEYLKQSWKPGDCYHTKTVLTNDEMNRYLEYIARIKNPNNGEPLALIEKIGITYEKRPLYLVKISSDHSKQKPIIFFQAGLSARDWSSVSAARYMIRQLVRKFTKNEEILRDIDFYIIPVANPDGYVHAENVDRLWIKNRARNSPRVDGVDLNRNFGFPHWQSCQPVKYSVDDPTWFNYRGPAPFSEPETVSIQAAGMRYQNRTRAFVSIQSVGAMVLYPWGFTTDSPHNEDILKFVADQAAEAMNYRGGERYESGKITQFIFPENLGGTIDDYFMGSLNIRMTFVVKLSSGEKPIPVTQPESMSRIARQAFEGFKVIAKYAVISAEAGETSRRMLVFG